MWASTLECGLQHYEQPETILITTLDESMFVCFISDVQSGNPAVLWAKDRDSAMQFPARDAIDLLQLVEASTRIECKYIAATSNYFGPQRGPSSVSKIEAERKAILRDFL